MSNGDIDIPDTLQNYGIISVDYLGKKPFYIYTQSRIGLVE